MRPIEIAAAIILVAFALGLGWMAGSMVFGWLTEREETLQLIVSIVIGVGVMAGMVAGGVQAARLFEAWRAKRGQP